MDAEDAVRRRHHPVDQRRLFQVGDAIETSRDPVSRGQHVAGDLRLHGVHIVHQARRTDDAYEEDEASCGDNDPTSSSTSTKALAVAASSSAISIFHRFIQMNRTIRPHK